MTDEDDRDDARDPTDSQAVGLGRELVRTLSGLMGHDPDRAAKEFDRTVESVTTPDTEAEDLDKQLRRGISLARGARQEGTKASGGPEAIPIEVANAGDSMRVLVDEPHDEVAFKRQQQAVQVITDDDRERRITFPFHVGKVNVVSESGDIHAEVVVSPSDPGDD